MSLKPSKQAQLRAEQERKRRQRQYLLIGGGVAAALLVVVGIVFAMSQPRVPTSTGSANCGNLLVKEDGGRDHLSPGDPTPVYQSNPPTSGTHNAVWSQAGIYTDNADVTQFLHSMEHGYVVLYYNNLSPQELSALQNLQRGDSYKMIVAPFANMDAKVALVAWNRLQTCDGLNEAAIRSFVAQFRNQGPEQAP